ncbi:MAG TPA: hypothetical protein VGP26_24455 [Actinophytocola sp.]|jgi:hypothetical protein|nr:hypothetical protein [Actinophytocola sp.]
MTEHPKRSFASPWNQPPPVDVDPSEGGSTAGAGAPPPARAAEEVVELRAVTNTVLEQVQDAVDLLADVTRMLADAHSARPGALVQITVAADSLRHAANQLEGLTRRETGEHAPAGRLAR